MKKEDMEGGPVSGDMPAVKKASTIARGEGGRWRWTTKDDQGEVGWFSYWGRKEGRREGGGEQKERGCRLRHHRSWQRRRPSSLLAGERGALELLSGESGLHAAVHLDSFWKAS
jgi:hypothetical protein